MARLSCAIFLLALVAQTFVLVSAKRSLHAEAVDYDEEYLSVSPTGSITPGQTVPSTTTTTTTTNGPKNTTTTVTTQSTYSTNATVPAVKMAATLSTYATVAQFTDTERARYVDVLEASILANLKVVSNVTIDDVKAGSIVVTNTVAFTGADGAAASSAATSLTEALSSSSNGAFVSTLFGTSFGAVTVDPTSVSETTTTNPTATSGVGAAGISLMAMAGATIVLGLAQFGL